MTRSAALLAVLALTSALAACGDESGDGTPTSLTTSSSPRPSASAGPSASGGPSATTASPTGTPTAPAQEDAPEDFPADTSTDTAEPSGGPLTVRAVRVAHSPGYDRVVFELAGRAPGQAGWRVEYVDSPTQEGSGEPVEVDGDAVLSVRVSGTGYPMDTGVEEVADDPALPGDLGVVTDVVLGAVFEGQYEAFIGTSAQAPFRVFRLGDPERVVVDVRVP